MDMFEGKTSIISLEKSLMFLILLSINLKFPQRDTTLKARIFTVKCLGQLGQLCEPIPFGFGIIERPMRYETTLSHFFVIVRHLEELLVGLVTTVGGDATFARLLMLKRGNFMQRDDATRVNEAEQARGRELPKEI